MSRLINRLAALYIVCWVFIPPLQVDEIYRNLAVALAIVWVVTSIYNDSQFFSENKVFIVASIACAALMILWRCGIGSLSSAITNTIQFIIFIIIAAISLYYQKNDFSFLKIMMTVMLALVLIFSITTIQGVLEDPYAARIATSEWLEGRFERNPNVGLYGYIYMAVFLLPMLIYIKLNGVRVNKLFDILAIVDIIVVFPMIILSGYMIANVCCLLGCIIVILTQRATPVRIVGLIALGLFFVFYYESIVTAVFDGLIDLLGDNPVYSEKLADFKSLFLEGDTTGGTVDGRFDNYSSSLRNIINYPVLGAYFFGDLGGGGHSSILDMLGRFGWGISIIYFYILMKFPHSIFDDGSRWNVINYIIVILLIVFGITDPYPQELAIAVFLFFPFTKRITSQEFYHEQNKFMVENEP